MSSEWYPDWYPLVWLEASDMTDSLLLLGTSVLQKTIETGLRELWRLSSGRQVGDSAWQLLSITATTKAKGCTQTWLQAFLNMNLIIRRDLFICPNFANA